MKEFTAQQREIVARKLGYDGPMAGFNDFISSSPALGMKYAAITDKFAERMARGGVVRRKYYVEGGTTAVNEDQVTTTAAPTPAPSPAPAPTPAADPYADLYRSVLNRDPDQAGLEYWQQQFGTEIDENERNTFIAAAQTELNANAAPPPPAPAPSPAPAPAPVSASNISDFVTQVYNDPSKTVPEKAAIIRNAAQQYGVTYEQIAAAINVPLATVTDYLNQGLPTTAPAPAPADDTPTSSTVEYGDRGRPVLTATPYDITPAQVQTTAGQQVSTAPRAGEATTATGAAPITAARADATAPVTAAQMEATKVAGQVSDALANVQAAQGTIRDENLVTAQQMAPTSTSLMGLEAAQGTAREVVGAPTRTLQEEEIVSGTAVNQARVEQALEATKASAAQGVVTAEMTVQGQLNNLLAEFEAGSPPPWAAANLRNATAAMAARGIGASSLAGQAIIQATLESALPIASADAAAYQSIAAQNLSNRQQAAMLVAQQRAAFLGQEFDQTFQTRVLNAAKVSDIANMNFSAQQQIALENARLAQTMDLANLSNQQAVIMAQAAQMANLETANLNNRQQAAVFNAKAFLDMDMANLDRQQQTSLFKAQQLNQALLTDAAAANAAAQFNAVSTNQANQFNATLATQVSQFNAAQTNAIAQFNTEQSNVLARFNAEQTNLREQFNASQRLVIDQSNAQWEREIATANTAATNAANLTSAQLATNLTIAEYNNEVQMYRDQINQVWQSGENDAQRATSIAAAEISAAATITASVTSAAASIEAARIRAAGEVNVAEINAESRLAVQEISSSATEDAAESAAWGNIAGRIITSKAGEAAIGRIFTSLFGPG